MHLDRTSAEARVSWGWLGRPEPPSNPPVAAPFSSTAPDEFADREEEEEEDDDDDEEEGSCC